VYHWPRWSIEIGAWLNTIPNLQYRSLIALKMKSGFPIRGRLHPAHYGILYYVKKGGSITFNVVRHKTPICRHCSKEIRDYGGYRKKFDKFEDKDGIPWIQISDFWEDTRPARQDKTRRNQVNELPFHIPERIILMGSNPGDIVLDIFGGGGSTYHASQLHKRYWIGSEIASLEPALSRFATIWGRNTKKIIPSKIQTCFDDDFLKKTIKRNRTKESIKNVKLMNLKAINGDIQSKSKVL
jgi:site-specific DNA-methyltransferase (adenine-specific)